MPQLTETYHTINVPVPFPDVEERKFLGMRVERPHHHFSKPQTEELAKTVEVACRALDANGYEIIAITPVIAGNVAIYPKAGGGHGYTAALLITAKRLDAINQAVT